MAETEKLTAAEVQAVKMIGLINVEYRLKDDVADVIARAKLWAAELSQYPQEIVTKALHNVIRTSTFPPRLADICNEIERIYSALDSSPEELWAKIKRMLPVVEHNAAGYRSDRELERCRKENEELYDSLPEEARLYVQNVDELIELSRMTDEALTFEKARFIKRVPELKAHIRARNSLPPEIFAIVSKAASTLLPSQAKYLTDKSVR